MRKDDGIFWIVAKIYLTQFHEHYSSKYSFLLHPIPIRVESRLHVRETAFPPPPHSLQMDKRRQLGKFRWARIPLRARAAANVKQRCTLCMRRRRKMRGARHPWRRATRCTRLVVKTSRDEQTRSRKLSAIFISLRNSGRAKRGRGKGQWMEKAWFGGEEIGGLRTILPVPPSAPTCILIRDITWTLN